MLNFPIWLTRRTIWTDSAFSRQKRDFLKWSVKLREESRPSLPSAVKLWLVLCQKKLIDRNDGIVPYALYTAKGYVSSAFAERTGFTQADLDLLCWRAEDLRLGELPRFLGLYRWPFAYDSFLGYMAGLLPIIEVASGKPTSYTSYLRPNHFSC